MRYARVDEAGKVIGHISADPEHAEAAAERGEHLIEIGDDAPYMLDEIDAYLAQKSKVNNGA